VSLIEHALHKPFLIFRKFLLHFHQVSHKIWSHDAARDFISPFS
jgi:hypothetical protein